MTPMTDEMNVTLVEGAAEVAESAMSGEAPVADLSIGEGVLETAGRDTEASAVPDVSAEAPQAAVQASEAVPVSEGAAREIAERELRGIVESLLFVSPEPLSVQRLVAIMGDVTKADVAQALRGLGEELEQEGRGVRLVEIAAALQVLLYVEAALPALASGGAGPFLAGCGHGWTPPALDTIDWAQSVTIDCTAPRALRSLSNVVALPTSCPYWLDTYVVLPSC